MSTSLLLDAGVIGDLRDTAQQPRVDSVRCSAEPGSMVATRTAFGQALAALGDARPEVVVLDGEVSDSTRTGFFAEKHPDRFFEFYIAEQQMLAAAVGMQVRGWIPFAATFAAFFTRALDFIRITRRRG
jgi:transketolase